MGDKVLKKTNIGEQRYRVLIDNAPEAVLIFDVTSGRFIDANKAAIALLRFSREELFQLGPSDLSPPFYKGVFAADKTKEYIDEALNGGNPAFDWIHLDRNGREIPCEVRLIRFPPYDKPILRASIIDLTEKQKLEASLTEREERLKLTLEVTGLGCFDWFPEGNFVHWDTRMHDLFGLDPSDPLDLIDRNAFFFQCIHPDDQAEVLQNFQTIMDPECKRLTFEDEYRILRDGNVRHMFSRGVIVRAKNGTVRRLIGTVQDMTERVLIDQQLKYQATLLNKVSDAIITTDTDFVVRSWNKAAEKMYGWTAAEALGQLLRDIVPTQYITGDRDDVVNLLLNDGTWNGEVIQKNKKGEELYILASVTLLKDEYGKTKGSIGVTRDISDRKQAELSLRESEAFHRSVYDNSLNAILIADNKGKLHSFNNAARDMLGIGEEALSQMAIFDLPITNVHDKEKWFKEVLEKRKGVGELTINPPGQEKRVTQYYAVRVSEDFNLFVLVDITQRKKVEETLKDREERFRTVFNQQFQIMVLLSPEGRVIEINELPLQITGTRSEDYIGAYIWETPAWANLPEWQSTIKAQVLKAGRVRKTLLAEDAYMTTNGEMRWADAAYTAIRNEQQEVKYILLQASDITERKLTQAKLSQTQQELSELTKRFQISTRAAKIGIWDWNTQDDILIWDETMMEIYGISGKNLSIQIKDWQQYLYPDDLNIFKEMIRWRSIGKKKLINTEFRIQREDGAIRNIKAVGSILCDDEGQAIRIIGTNWDITQEKEAEQERIRYRQLEARNRELEQFAYVASHDLQEPLRTVISFVGLLKRGYEDKLDERGLEYLQFVVDASVRMSQLIKGLLEYSRIGTNRQLSLVDTNGLIQNILDDLSAQINQTQALISVGPMPKITGYETELRLLFQNLISNAIKFRKPDRHPVIHIEVKEEKNRWLFTVSDQGIGIDPLYRKQIFSLFQRLHGIEQYEGTGIGLAHCQKIVDLHGGTIWVESTNDQGSAFYFSIAKNIVD